MSKENQCWSPAHNSGGSSGKGPKETSGVRFDSPRNAIDSPRNSVGHQLTTRVVRQVRGHRTLLWSAVCPHHSPPNLIGSIPTTPAPDWLPPKPRAAASFDPSHT